MTTKTRTVRRPQQIEESKMQGYFMISKRDASVAIVNKLTGSQCRLWLYLMIVDPFADNTSGGEVKYHDLPSIAEMSIALGSSPDTVEKDLRRLRNLGLYEYRTVTVQGHNLTAAKAKAEAESLKSKSQKNSRKSSQDKESAYLSPDSAYLSPDSAYLSPDSAYLSPDSAYLSGNEEPEPLPDKDSNAPSNYSNYSNLNKSLSEDERERFLEFANKKASELPTPPTLPGKWIEANFEELRELFEKQESSMGSTHCGGGNSTNVLDFKNWDDSTHTGQYHTLMSLGLAKFCENSISKAWYEWATVKHPERFVNVPE
jgi:DNA-binding transcriptional regulator YhcF (GntR family)